MSSRRVEEVDSNGRRRVTILEEETPLGALDREVAGEQEVMETHPDAWNVARGWLRTFGAFVAVAFFVIETVIMFRFGFLLANANPNNGFVDFIYDLSGGLVEPFEGIVSTDTVGDGVFEPASLIAFVVYAAVALLLTMLLWAASSAPSAAGDRAVTTRSRHRTREIRGE